MCVSKPNFGLNMTDNYATLAADMCRRLVHREVLLMIVDV